MRMYQRPQRSKLTADSLNVICDVRKFGVFKLEWPQAKRSTFDRFVAFVAF